MQVLEFVTCWAALWSHFCPASCWHSAVILQYRETHIPQSWRVPLFVLKVITPATGQRTQQQKNNAPVLCVKLLPWPGLYVKEIFISVRIPDKVNVRKKWINSSDEANLRQWRRRQGTEMATTLTTRSRQSNGCFRCWDNNTYNLGCCW